jgi:hypothetical protein
MNGLTVSRLSLVTIFLILRLMLPQLLLAFRIEHGAVSFFSAAIRGPTLFFSWSEVVTALPTGLRKMEILMDSWTCNVLSIHLRSFLE